MTIRVLVFKADTSRIPPKKLQLLLPVITAPPSAPGKPAPEHNFLSQGKPTTNESKLQTKSESERRSRKAGDERKSRKSSQDKLAKSIQRTLAESEAEQIHSFDPYTRRSKDYAYASPSTSSRSSSPPKDSWPSPNNARHLQNRYYQTHDSESTNLTDTSQIFEVSDEMYPSPTNGSLTTESDYWNSSVQILENRGVKEKCKNAFKSFI